MASNNSNEQINISVIIHTYNAEKHLHRVLESVKDFDEIIICDMYSTDRTLEIASQYNCKVIYYEYTGIAEPARNYAISNASNEWVLVVDADEIVTESLRLYLYDYVKINPTAGGIRISRKNYFLGRYMHAAYPDYILRFFKKKNAYWPPTVHSSPQITGLIDSLPRNRKDLALIHLANDPLATSIIKLNTYSSFEVERRKNESVGYIALLFKPFFRFLHYYIFKGGIRDGIPGLVFALRESFYKFATIAKIIESRIKPHDYDKELLH